MRPLLFLLLFRWIRSPIFQLLSIIKCHQTVKWSTLQWHFLSFCFNLKRNRCSPLPTLAAPTVTLDANLFESAIFLSQNEATTIFQFFNYDKLFMLRSFIVCCMIVWVWVEEGEKKKKKNLSKNCHWLVNWRANAYFPRVTINNSGSFFLLLKVWNQAHLLHQVDWDWAPTKIGRIYEKFISIQMNEKWWLTQKRKQQRNSDQMFVDFIKSYLFLCFACRFWRAFRIFRSLLTHGSTEVTEANNAIRNKYTKENSRLIRCFVCAHVADGIAGHQLKFAWTVHIICSKLKFADYRMNCTF